MGYRQDEIQGDTTSMEEKIKALEVLEKIKTKFEIINGCMFFKTEDAAKDYFDETEGCESDDVDKEEARFERWFNSNNIQIKD